MISVATKNLSKLRTHERCVTILFFYEREDGGRGGGREGGIPEAFLVSISKIFKDYLHICIAVHALFSI